MSAALKTTGGGSDAPRHFLELMDLDTPTLRHMLELGRRSKRGEAPGQPLAGKTVALIFELPSTRTRVSFEVGIRQLGGTPLVLTAKEIQLNRGESIKDTARVLSRYVDAIMLRTADVAQMRELAEYATIPVINGLTNISHPCQLMADVMTFEEHRGPIAGQVVAWTGDGNNVAQSYIQAAARFGFILRIATPPELEPPAELLAWARREGARIELSNDPVAAVQGARAVVTDCWISMSDEKTAAAQNRHNMLMPFQLNSALLRHAAPDAIVLHCLPAHRGEEITDEVMDGPQSVVFDEAENRLHAQKGILLWAFGAG